MNANELADYLDNNVEAMIMSEQQYIDQAATMLRQQQAEIEALKRQNEAIKKGVVTMPQLRKLYLYAFTDGELLYKRANDASFRHWVMEKISEEDECTAKAKKK